MVAKEERISFKNGPNRLVGILRSPESGSVSVKLPALIMVTPGSSVKEQIGSNYARAMVEHGFVTLTFDPCHQGESEGFPRDLENPAVRIEDVVCAVDYLSTVSTVDEEKIGLIGICAGGGYAVGAAKIDHRVKALGAVVPVNIGRAFRQAQSNPGAMLATLEAVGKQRNVEMQGGEQVRVPWIPGSVEEAEKQGVDIDTMDAVKYYRTPQGQHPKSTGKLLMTSNAFLLGFDAFNLVEELLTQPVQVIVGGRLGLTFSYADGKTLWEKCQKKEEFVVIKDAGHYELYDKREYVDQAIEYLVAFFKKHLSE
ncbi:Alpha/Beta hydrolase protein [Kockovaella imperatae]|uniref:Alpha/Beta hydrolase protein n=1 Tax=Kockovaella imperatae TaxID=4999 RepID=A0A1Y1UEC2_9TREE|nr:Alpha/Beta hydrolase protein [Kockovaella imperatae]ORX35877.1 Alpha/Beta hydrolase protein [Kockovaella imperatae]